MVKHLMFILYGPMASWGMEAPGTTRPTSDHPTKSAVLGLVAGALGITNDRDQPHLELAEALGYAVRVDSPGLLLRDYHTVQTAPTRAKATNATRRDELTKDPGALETTLTTRDYRQDGCWTVALWEHDASGSWLERIEAALQNPRFIPFLGRKSCPLGLPVQGQLIEAGTLAQAFEAYQPPLGHLLNRIERAESPLLYTDVDHPATGLDASDERRVRDAVSSRVRRQFRQRSERIVTMHVPVMQVSGGDQ